MSPTPELHYCELCKGQKISEGNCDFFNSLNKQQQKISMISALASKKSLNEKNTGC